MQKNHFVFADLSTYDLDIARSFYAAVFDWDYRSEDGSYLMAMHRGQSIAGLYETPQKFKDMNMPSFWMSYVEVESVTASVALAKDAGGIVELVELDNPVGKIALIRDPLGAGFTIYEGNQLQSRYTDSPSALVWNALFISDIAKVKPFYETLFSWSIEPTALTGEFDILDIRHQRIGSVYEVANRIKGKYEYWGVYFASNDLPKLKKAVLANGGSVVYEDGSTKVYSDPFGAFFHILPVSRPDKAANKALVNPKIKWKAIIGLLLILIGIVGDWTWLWSLFFTFWVVQDLRSGQTYLMETVSRTQNPILYWVILLVWMVFIIFGLVPLFT
ncbi:MAG: VOC family protein [Flavobacteriaceae bacterium]|nr:VOC family protein [Flavobacteriaceae bacterium]